MAKSMLSAQERKLLSETRIFLKNSWKQKKFSEIER